MANPSTIPTNNAIPSQAIPDLYFNIELLDILVNGSDLQATSRLGVSLDTWRGISSLIKDEGQALLDAFAADSSLSLDTFENEAGSLLVNLGIAPVAPVDWVAGATVANSYQVYHYTGGPDSANGYYFNATGSGTIPSTPVGDSDWRLYALDDVAFNTVSAAGSGEMRLMGEWLQGLEYSHATVADAKADDALKIGSIVRTRGHVSEGDGLNALYIVTAAGANTPDEYRYIDLAASGLQMRCLTLLKSNSALLELRKLQMASGATLEVVCFGDSITFGTGASATSAGYPAQLQGMVQDFYGNPNINLTNRGIGGDNTQSLLDRYDTAMSTDPHVVLIMIGMNDAFPGGPISTSEYAENLDTLYSKMKIDGIAILAADITPRKRRNNEGPERIEGYRRVMREVAAKHGIEVVPMFDLLTGLTQVAHGYDWADLSNDGIHYTDLGYQQIAGAWMTHGLATDTLKLAVGERRDAIEPFVFGYANPDLSYELVESDAAKMKETAILRYNGNANAGQQARTFVWVDKFKPCDLVINCTREKNADRLPRLLVANPSVPDAGSRKLFLGENSSPEAGVYGVPALACQLRPGFNEVRMRCDDGETAQIASFQVVERDPRIARSYGLVNERYNGALPFSNGVDQNGPPQDVGVGALAIAPGGTANLGVISNNAYVAAVSRPWARYLLRATLSDGFRFDIGMASYPGAETTSAASIRLTDEGGGLITATAFIHWDTGDEEIASVTTNVAFSSDTRILIHVKPDAFEMYFGSSTSNLIAIPFAIGVSNLLATSGTGTSYLNTLKEMRPDQTAFGESSGDSWIDFNGKRIVHVIAGAQVSAALT